MTYFYMFSLSDLERMMSAVELFSEMLRAVNPNDREVCMSYVLIFSFVYSLHFDVNKRHIS